jgi:hypothetical protein
VLPVIKAKLVLLAQLVPRVILERRVPLVLRALKAFRGGQARRAKRALRGLQDSVSELLKFILLLPLLRQTLRLQELSQVSLL